MAFKILPIFGRNKEEDTLKSVKKLMKEIEIANGAFKDCVNFWLKEDYIKVKETINLISEHEEKADRINRRISMQLYGGAFLPGTRFHINELVEVLDDVIDGILHSVEMFRFMQGKKFNNDFKKAFLELSKEASLAVEKLDVVIDDLLENNDKIMYHIKQAKDFEHSCDVLKEKIQELAYFSKGDPLTNILLAKTASKISAIGDAVEDASRQVVVLKLQRSA